jgi:hypothetical protein
VFAWLNQEGDMMESVSTYMVVGQWYPSRREGLYLKGGVGLGRYGQDFNYSSFSDLGFAGNLGLGYEFRVGRKVSLGPIFDVYQATFHGRSYPSYRERVLNLGVSVLISEH